MASMPVAYANVLATVIGITRFADASTVLNEKEFRRKRPI
jgi:hypothetical protein